MIHSAEHSWLSLDYVFVCSVIVSLAAVALKPLQDANIKLDKQKYILQAAGFDGNSSDRKKMWR